MWRKGCVFAPLLLGAVLASSLGGCGFFVPQKHPLLEDTKQEGDLSLYGGMESQIIAHIQCEISEGIWEVKHSQLANRVPWLYKPILSGAKGKQTKTQWGTSATLTLTFQDQSSLNPGVSLTTPLENSVRTFPVGGNVTSPQSVATAFGGSGSANATRTETIQFTYTNADLLHWGEEYFSRDPHYCEKAINGITISSDLKIDQFIYDKATIAALAVDIGRVPVTWPPFDTFQEQINFVISYGASATPTWKFARVAVNSTGTFLSATRTDTDALTITIGAVTPASSTQPAQLKSAGQSLHNEGVGGTLTGTQGRGTAPASGN